MLRLYTESKRVGWVTRVLWGGMEGGADTREGWGRQTCLVFLK